MAKPQSAPRWASRIVRLDTAVDPATLLANPLNARMHPERQRSALRAALDQLGWISTVVVNERSGRMIDGHARIEEAMAAGERGVPVLYVDLDDDEERIALATFDAITDLAVYDKTIFDELVAGLVMPDELGAVLAGIPTYSGDELAALLAGIAPAEEERGSDEYYTPRWLFDVMGIDFDLDVCAPEGGLPWIPAKRSLSLVDDGLATPWEGRVWMNPPYSRPGPWVEKFIQHGDGVALLPFSAGAWFGHIWQHADAISCPPDIGFHDFIGGGIPMATHLAAFGAEAVEAVAKVGPARQISKRLRRREYPRPWRMRDGMSETELSVHESAAPPAAGRWRAHVAGNRQR